MKKTLTLILVSAMLVSAALTPVSAIFKYTTDTVVPENDFHTPVQYDYIHDPDPRSVATYADGESERSIPNAIICDFSSDNVPDSDTYVIQKSADPDFTDPVTVTGLTEKKYGFYNLFLGEHFYWRGGASAASVADSPVHEMTVTDVGPRNLYVPNLSNVRDIGGYSSSLIEGGKIRQGLYYRGMALVELEEYALTEEGVKTLIDDLGVRAEIDLRDAGACTGPYFDEIEYHAVPIPSGSESRRFEEFWDEYYEIFTVISEADEKPVYLHCSAGADRTGISTFILLNLLGVDYTDILRDYLFTNFSVMGARRAESEFDKWWKKLDQQLGTTPAEDAKDWLREKDVEPEKAEKIREIFVDGYISPSLHNAKTYKITDVTASCDLLLSEAVTLASDAPASGFVGVRVDGKALFDKDYTVDASGKVTLAPEYLDTLKSGTHTAEIVSDDGTASADFTVSGSLPTSVKGDVNSDGAVNAKDVSAFLKYIAGWDVSILTANADVTSDGTCNAKDVALIMKHLAGWDVKLG